MNDWITFRYCNSWRDFSGILNDVCGLEVVQVLVEHNISLTHPAEVVIFEEEEGATLLEELWLEVPPWCDLMIFNIEKN